MELDLRVAILKDKETKLANYNKMIDETDLTYNRVILYNINLRLLKHQIDQQQIQKKKHNLLKIVLNVLEYYTIYFCLFVT